MPAFLILLVVAALFSSAYLSLMLMMGYGMFRLRKQTSIPGEASTRVTVVIPARNEEATIGRCLEGLSRQDYPLNLVEVLVMDDGSGDNTHERAKEAGSINPGLRLSVIPVTTGPSGITGKKEAIRQAAEVATGELILLTDADTVRGPGWISAVADHYVNFHPKMILGPVAFLPEDSLFAKIQSVEFLSLMTATAGLCRAGLPVMCNGANLAVERAAFLEAGGYGHDLRYRSGDDIFLMSRIRKRYGAEAIRFLRDERSIVQTPAAKRLPDFWQQRLRWVSKSRGYRDFPIILTAFATYLFNVLLLAGLVAGIFDPLILVMTLALILLKTATEFPSVYRMAGFLGKRTLLWFFLPVQFLNILYVSVVGLAGHFLSFEWKGRTS